jgi:protein MAK16
LRSGAYGDRPINVEGSVWERVMKGLQREGELKGDIDLDDGVEDEDEEAEYEHELENGVGEVEYVSDVEESDVDDMEEFDDWMGGQSPEEGSDDDDDESETGSEEDDESEDEDAEALKKTLANLKRKRPAGPPPKPKKKPTKGDKKGPKREIEYEIEREPAAREAMRI